MSRAPARASFEGTTADNIRGIRGHRHRAASRFVTFEEAASSSIAELEGQTIFCRCARFRHREYRGQHAWKSRPYRAKIEIQNLGFDEKRSTFPA